MVTFLQAEEGEKVIDFFLIRERELKQATNGSEYANFVLERNLALIPAKLWDVTTEQKTLFKRGTVVKVEAVVTLYRNLKHSQIQRIRQAVEEDQINVTELVSRKGVSREDLWHELRMLIEEIESTPLQAIITKLFSQRTLRERLTTFPAAKTLHHSYYAGLLEQIVELAHSAIGLLPYYLHVNKNIVLTACLLHDIGKTKAFSEPIAPEYTTEAELIGPLVLGIELINEAAKEAGIEADHEELLALKHCILSQNGDVNLGWGSAVSPKTNEAIFFQHVKQMNTQLNALSLVREQANSEWTYSPLFKRKMYTKNDQLED